jgi:hypothetical protein
MTDALRRGCGACPPSWRSRRRRRRCVSRRRLKWINAGIPGVDTAVVKGDMKKGASHFYLKYAGGFAAPVHHHSPDHFATTVTGNLVLVVDGKEHRLPPGSYFAFTGKAKHAAPRGI